MHRFIAPGLDPGDDIVVLPRDEAEHLTRVLRLSAGDLVHVFDGRGHEFLAKVVSAARRDASVQIVSPVDSAVESPVAITLVQAVLKGDKMDDVVRDAVMLGVTAIQPVVTRRAETTVAALIRGARVERWRRVALASVKQSGRAVMPEIRSPLAFGDWLADRLPALTLMLAEPAVRPNRDATELAPGDVAVESWIVLRQIPVPLEAAIVVGPEGGWFEAEWTAALARGVRLVRFGPRTLRADAVAVAALSVLQFLWDS